LTLLALLGLLATALLLGGMVFFAALVAPLVFRTLPGEPGLRLIRALFPRYYLWVLGCSAAAAVALFPLSKPDSGVMAVVAGLALWLRQALMPRVNALSDRARDGDAAAKRHFARAHGLSVLANLLQMLAAAVVLAGFVI
jgi:F0F1-type ATP synthase assembly protein I